MTNLTEKWKKGELPEGHYYVKDGENMIAEYLDGYFYNDGLPMTSFSGGVDEVLTPVPSYEKWIMTKNLSERAHIEMYKARGEKVKLKNENTKLKDLLKDCRYILEIEKNFPSCAFEKDRLAKLIAKINQVLEKNNAR